MYQKNPRRYQSKWVDGFQWIQYSASEDGVFCDYLFISVAVMVIMTLTS